MQDRGRAIDKTHLSCEQAEERGFLHRDYIAHCLRWSHVVKHLGIKNRYKTAQILDIGCGKETPLIKTLYTMRMTPEVYVGVDYNKQPPRPSENPIHKKIYDKERSLLHQSNLPIYHPKVLFHLSIYIKNI